MKRRDFLLASTVLGAGLTTLPRSSAAEAAPPKSTPPNPSPDLPSAEHALEILMAGNARFVEGKSAHPNMTEDWLQRLTEGQQPIATILTCSDSRVPPELLFDQGFGDLFTVRVAGNVVTRYGIGSMEYAQHHLQTRLYIVLGHEGCGAVTAAMLPRAKRDLEPKGVRELLDLIHVGHVDSEAESKTKLTRAIEANVRHATRVIWDLDPEDEGFQPKKGETLVSAVYELSTGRVRVLEKYVAE